MINATKTRWRRRFHARVDRREHEARGLTKFDRWRRRPRARGPAQDVLDPSTDRQPRAMCARLRFHVRSEARSQVASEAPDLIRGRRTKRARGERTTASRGGAPRPDTRLHPPQQVAFVLGGQAPPGQKEAQVLGGQHPPDRDHSTSSGSKTCQILKFTVFATWIFNTNRTDLWQNRQRKAGTFDVRPFGRFLSHRRWYFPQN